MNAKKYGLYLLVIVIFISYAIYDAKFKKSPIDIDVIEEVAVNEEDGSTLVKEKVAISTVSPIATEVGRDILESGGNAVDAAVAISYVLGVIEPQASGLGGGGGMLIEMVDSPATFIDYREISDASTRPPSSKSAIPGFVLGMEYVAENYGNKKIQELINPAIDKAEKGFALDENFIGRLERNKEYIQNIAPYLYTKSNPKVGDLIVQEDLAKTLKEIHEKGSRFFYSDILKKQNLFNFELETVLDKLVIEREPIVSNIGETTIYSAPPPFSGMTVVDILEMGEKEGVSGMVSKDSTNLTKYLQIVQQAYEMRDLKNSDPSFSEYNYKNRKPVAFDSNKDFYSLDEVEAPSTTHFSVVDKEGNKVSVTNTIGEVWGAGIVYEGFFLNNALVNFSSTTNPNSYEAYKKPRTYMAPTIVNKGSEALIIGSPGGNRIPQIIAQVLIDFEETGNLKNSIELPRVTLEGNTASFEVAQAESLADELKAKGFNVNYVDFGYYFGGINAIHISDEVESVADFRRYRQSNAEESQTE